MELVADIFDAYFIFTMIAVVIQVIDMYLLPVEWDLIDLHVGLFSVGVIVVVLLLLVFIVCIPVSLIMFNGEGYIPKLLWRTVASWGVLFLHYICSIELLGGNKKK